MKKSLSLLLALVMVLSLTACGGSTTPTTTAATTTVAGDTTASSDATTATSSEAVATPSGSVTVGQGTELSGDWIATFTNNAADAAVLNMISGYSAYEKNFDGEYVLNPTVVKEQEVTTNEDGSKTFTFTIVEDLTWNDGTPITAANYVGSHLLWNSKFIADLGGKNAADYRLLGHSAYSKGETEAFAGVHLLGDYKFSLTINPEYLPYYFENLIVASGPVNLNYWLGEGVEIEETEAGAKFKTAPTVDTHKEHFEAARNNPIYVVCGPYQVTSYDTAAKIAVCTVNPLYKGNFEGRKPMIETVVFKRVLEETQMDELATGQVDILMEMMSGKEIEPGLALVEKGGFDFINYPRAGYGKITFVCDYGPTQFVEVRQAIAHLLNRNEFAKTFTGGFGSVVNGPYGESHWFYQESRAELNSLLNQYPYDLDAAVKLLEEGGWVYAEDGSDYKEGLRYKKLEDGTLMPLELQWCSSSNNPVSELLTIMLQNNVDVEKAGIKITRTEMTFPELLNYYYRDGSQDAKYSVPTYHMYNLATSFSSAVYDMINSYTTDPDRIAQGYNVNFLIDVELEQLAKDMLAREGTDREGFRKGFVAFIDRWNELLPDLPLYSNLIHHFFNAKVKDYYSTPFSGIALNLLYSRVEE